MTTLSPHAGPRSARAAGLSAASSAPSLAARLSAWSQPLRQALLVGSAVLLVACGGGGGGGGVAGGSDVGDPGAPPAPAGLSLGPAGIKTLKFKWDAVTGATHYKLFEDLDGAATAAAPAEINVASGGLGGGMITGAGYSHEVPLYERLNATYTLRACNALGCSASSPSFKPSIADLNAAIGYAKSPGGGMQEEQYGFSIALSKDGQTLAVGAPAESSGAPYSGAVYVMRRSAAGVWAPLQTIKDTVASDSEFFGLSLALSANGNVLAVGVPNGIQNLGSGGTGATGHVQMFTFDAGLSAYTATDLVTAPIISRAVGDWFGYSVALDNTGDVLAVGVHLNAEAAFAEPGAVHILTRDGTAWTDPQIITASNGEGNDSFGYAIALSGDGKTLAVGAFQEDGGFAGIGTAADAMNDDDSLTRAGAVYVFSRSGTAATDLFSNQIYIKANDPAASDRFGSAVALSDDGGVLSVGAVTEDSSGTGVGASQDGNGAPDSGAVYVFVRNAGVWSQEVYIKPSNTTVSSQFGAALAMSSDGNTLAVGARYELRTGVGLVADLNAAPGADFRGAVYVFKRSAGVWSQSAYVKSPSNSSPGDSNTFGSSLAISGDGSSLAVGDSYENHQASPAEYPIVGAPADDNGSAPLSGAVYLF